MANNVVFFDPSLKIESITPTLDDETFQFFLETYYEWMQTSNVEITGLSGAFSNGETIVGQTSAASAKIKQIGDGYIIVKMNTDEVFDIKETITGQTSGNTAVVGTIDDNIIRDISRIQANKDPRRAVGDYLEYLKNDLNRGIPVESATDRRELISKVRDLFKSKSTEETYKTLFRALFNEIIELRYPGDDLLRVSDGNFQKRTTVRVEPDNIVSGSSLTIFDFLNKTIEGQTSGAVAVVSNIRISFLGGVRFAEFTLRLISGQFTAGEILFDLLNPTTLRTTVFGVVASIDIVDGGTGYAVEDQVTITGDGQEAKATVSSVDSSPITKILLTSNGIGYRTGTTAVIDNAGTGGANLAIRVETIDRPYPVANGTYTVGEVNSVVIVNRGGGYVGVPTITLEDTTISALGLLHERLINIVSGGDLYEVGDALVATGGTGSTVATGNVAAVVENFSVATIEEVKDELISTYASSTFLDDFNSGTILFEDGFGMLEEGEYVYYDRLKVEEWRGIGPIERIEFTNYGQGYTPTGLPTFTVTSANGVGANIIATGIQGRGANVIVDVANNSGGLGAIREVTIIDQGINYTSANVDATSIGDGNAILTANVSGLFINPGFFADDDGKLNYKIIQDSLFYQDFSYVIRSGLSFTKYRDIVKQAVHPAGLEFFGEIVITSTIDASARFLSEVGVGETQPQGETILPVFSFLSLFAAANPPEVTRELRVLIDPPKFDQPLATNRQIEIEILPITIDLGLEFSDVISKQIVQIFKSAVNVAAQIAVSESGVPKSEFDFELEGAILTINIDREIIQKLGVSVIDAVINVTESTDESVQGPKVYSLFVNTSIEQVSTKYEVEIVSRVIPDEVILTFGDVEISEFKNELILSVSDVEFDNFYRVVSVSTPRILSEIKQVLQSDIDLTMAFFSDVQILETSVREVELTIPLYQSVAAQFGATKYELDLPTFKLESIYSYAELPISYVANETIESFEAQTFLGSSGIEDVLVEVIAPIPVEKNIEPIEINQAVTIASSFGDFPDQKFLQPQINVGSTNDRRIEIDITPTKPGIYGVLPIEALAEETLTQYGSFTFGTLADITWPNARARIDGLVDIKVPLYLDMTMAFYTEIVIAETEIRSVEIDIELYKSVAITSSKFYEIDISLDLTTVLTTESNAVEIDIEPNAIDKQISIASAFEDFPLVRTFTPEVSILSANDQNYKVELSSGDRYKDLSIESFGSQSIALYDDEVLGSKVAYGRAAFVNGKREFTYDVLEVIRFKDFTLEQLDEYQLGEVYRDNTVRRNIPISGTVTVPDPTIQALPINVLAAEQINTFANDTFETISTIKIIVLGSNTTFEEDFLVNDPIIIDDEKFIIKNIANSEYMEINVSASENYSNVTAYKEIFV